MAVNVTVNRWRVLVAVVFVPVVTVPVPGSTTTIFTAGVPPDVGTYTYALAV